MENEIDYKEIAKFAYAFVTTLKGKLTYEQLSHLLTSSNYTMKYTDENNLITNYESGERIIEVDVEGNIKSQKT